MTEPTDALAPRTEEEIDPHYEPVIKLTEQVDTKTGEEEDEMIFKMRAKLFRFDSSSSEWKERGTGDVRLLQNNDTKKVRLVMRRDKTLKVCANHAITADMHLQPNIGSDRSWVWKVAADYSESPPTAETLAIRFANSNNAGEFKTEFERAQKINAGGAVEQAKAEEVKAEEPASTAKDPADKDESAEKAKEAAEEKENATGDQQGGKEAGEEAKQ